MLLEFHYLCRAGVLSVLQYSIIMSSEKIVGEKLSYSDSELSEFKAIINAKLIKANKDYETLREMLSFSSGNDVNDTSPTFKVLEEGASTLSKEELSKLAERQQKFIKVLEAALVRIENKTYGICRETGKLIPADRLRIVPHATLCVEVKQKR